MGYLWLLLTIATDMAGTWLLKLSSGLTKGSLVMIAMAFYLLSKAFFGLTIEKLPLGYAYAVWCGLGTLLACWISFSYFKESLSLYTWIGALFIISGIAFIELGSRSS